MTDFLTEHPTLSTAAENVLSRLLGLEATLQPTGNVQYFHHNELAQRAVFLGENLKAALHLQTANLHAASLATLRVALEHHIFDLLLFGADRYEQTFSGVTPGTWANWQAQIDSGARGTEDILQSGWRAGTVNVVRRGGGVRGPDGTVEYRLSPYYREYQAIDPFVGTAAEQEFLASGFTAVEHHKDFAAANEAARAGRLGWQNLLRNLRLNQLVDERWLRHAQVHYRFLGAYVHPSSKRAEDALYGNNFPPRIRLDDHCLSELIILYVLRIASAELRAFLRLADRAPSVLLADRDGLLQDISIAEAASDYLWFLGGRPHEYDRVQEANSRGLLHDGAESRALIVPRDERDPARLADSEIGYYRNPLRRLIEMHRSFNELTGFAYTSPLPCAAKAARW